MQWLIVHGCPNGSPHTGTDPNPSTGAAQQGRAAGEVNPHQGSAPWPQLFIVLLSKCYLILFA